MPMCHNDDLTNYFLFATDTQCIIIIDFLLLLLNDDVMNSILYMANVPYTKYLLTIFPFKLLVFHPCIY